jgi:hypothetical protein
MTKDKDKNLLSGYHDMAKAVVSCQEISAPTSGIGRN